CKDICTKSVSTEKTVKEDGMETENGKEGENEKQNDVPQKAWQPSFYIKVDKEVYYFADHEISIWQSFDNCGAIIWPATLALCQYLDANRGTVNLLDKAVLEIGAGTGLVSIVASLLGAWVTASDLPEVLANLRVNLSRNTRGRCRYTPQVAELSWSYDLEQTYPRSVYRYDYVLAADVVYQNDILAELLATMRHFCQPGTTLIWSNKIRFASDLAFLENFKNAFNTTLLADMGEVKIYAATTKEPEITVMLSKHEVEQEEEEEEEQEAEAEEENNEEGNIGDVSNAKTQDQEQPIRENIEETNDDNCEVESKENDNDKPPDSGMEEKSDPDDSDSNAQAILYRSWAPSVYYRLDKEIHYFMGHQITIQESIDSYGGMIWPAAVALSKFLETPAGQEQISLLDQETLELGAGTGLLSIVATLLGAKLTATDLPDLLGNLRSNLNRNTRGRRKYEPQVAALSWGHELEQRFPQSEYHYDYVLAADVVYHHDFLEELLVTMQYFCQPGTTLIWANKVRYPSDLVFIENFKKAFHTTLLAELDEVRIYLAIYRAPEEEDDHMKRINQTGGIRRKEKGYYYRTENGQEQLKKQEDKEARVEATESHADKQNPPGELTLNETDSSNGSFMKDEEFDIKDWQSEDAMFQQKEDEEEDEAQKAENDQEEDSSEKDSESEGAGEDEESHSCSEPKSISSTHSEERSDSVETSAQSASQRAWQPNMYYTPGKEIHYFLGHKISIEESLDSYGAVIWPAAVALCKFLETPAGRQQINLLDKSVLEIGAGTGLLSIVATLLGARLTATDLPEILSNLRYNLNRNTRSIRRHEPQIKELSWGHKLEETFPRSSYHYDYVLAADVVYHHGFLAELLVTMDHFCQPGTTIIWANKVRYRSDLAFVEDFKKTFHATLLTELDEVSIYRATYRAQGEKDDLINKEHNDCSTEMEHEEVEKQEHGEAKEESKTHWNQADEQDPAGAKAPDENETDSNNSCITGEIDTKERPGEDIKLQHEEEYEAHEPQTEEDKQEEYTGEEDRESEGAEKDEESQDYSESRSISSTHREQRSDSSETNGQSSYQKAWEHNMFYMPGKEIHYFLGHKISIEESIDSYGAMIWPAAVALSKYLETPEGQQQINLLDKSVLEIGAGTGLLSVVATLLGRSIIWIVVLPNTLTLIHSVFIVMNWSAGARLTATDLPEILSNLRYNLNRNTRSIRRHEPQIKELSWGHKLEETFPQSSYHYDYVLAADVVYHHGFLAELLVTMDHFCQPGTTIIWANKMRYPSDLAFVEDFKKTFHATQIAEVDEVRIYKGTHKSSEDKKSPNRAIQEKEDKRRNEERERKNGAIEKVQKHVVMKPKTEEDHPQELAGVTIHGETETLQKDRKHVYHRSHTLNVPQQTKKVHYIVGHEISIEESTDFYGAQRRPAALALCRFLDTTAGRQKVKLLDKSVLELGAGTGLVSVVATLLGANLTATDLPEILDSLRLNLYRNTRHHRRYEPQVTALSWGHKLEQTFPHSEYHYDYVVAADVVYHHDFLDELLDTMHYFCQPGTTLIWANEIRCPSDLVFTENFKKAFHATLIAELDEVKIYSATTKECGTGKDLEEDTNEEAKKPNFNKTVFKDSNEEVNEEENHDYITSADKEMAQKLEERKGGVIMKDPGGEIKVQELHEGVQITNDREKNGTDWFRSIREQKRSHVSSETDVTDEDEGYEEETTDDDSSFSWLRSRTEDYTEGNTGKPRSVCHKVSETDRKLCEERHYFAGHEIKIVDSFEPYGPTVQPAALALCKFLETNQINLKGKAVLELGAGTGMVSIVASFLGAWVTATDKPAVLDNLSSNLSRNTRGHIKHAPQVEALSWNDNLSRSFPHPTYHYDVVLAADVVYQHNLLDDLLATMRHFCQPGTSLIWANRVRTQTEMTFSKRFKRTFSTTLLAEMGEVEIYMARTRGQRWT
ncbi:hypothetical protein NFI96_011393, partial [Prochilodus magdalenae]